MDQGSIADARRDTGPERGWKIALGAGATALVLVLGALIGVVTGSSSTAAAAVRSYELRIQEKTIDYGAGNTWKAWTYNGTVPGPTMKVRLGETLRVKVINELDMVHSFHTHLTNYKFSVDGSQANTVGSIGGMSMIPPGKSYTYEFEPTTAGIFIYHCHSSDGNTPINQHILQGLYGLILVENPDDPPVRHETLFMAEMAGKTTGTPAPFIMNGLGLPGGEKTLEEIHHREGMEGITAQLGKTVPFFKMKVGETINLHVANIGNLDHTFHAHSATHVSLGVLGGRPWPTNTVPLMPGTADTIQVTFSQPGIWLFHCHVVVHADGGMIGLFIVEK